jgi:hypothetical protein
MSYLILLLVTALDVAAGLRPHLKDSYHITIIQYCNLIVKNYPHFELLLLQGES